MTFQKEILRLRRKFSALNIFPYSCAHDLAFEERAPPKLVIAARRFLIWERRKRRRGAKKKGKLSFFLSPPPFFINEGSFESPPSLLSFGLSVDHATLFVQERN
jgi:hypothetical protein